MSRGPGRVQREVLEVLRERAARLKHTWEADKPEEAYRWAGLRLIARTVSGRDDLDPELLAADHSLIESVRRAVKTLEHRGIVETGYIWYDTRDADDDFRRSVHGSGLHCRLSLQEFSAVRCDRCIGPHARSGTPYLIGGPTGLCLSSSQLSVDCTINTYREVS